MNKNEKHIRKHIRKLLVEITHHMVDTQVEMNQIPYDNCDMEPYEGTPVEDLVNCSYLSGKRDMLEEMKDILMFDHL
mgnify:CR=1 FL=1